MANLPSLAQDLDSTTESLPTESSSANEDGCSSQDLPARLVQAEERRRRHSLEGHSVGNPLLAMSGTLCAPQQSKAFRASRKADGQMMDKVILPPPAPRNASFLRMRSTSGSSIEDDQSPTRMENVMQRNASLKCELETYKLKVKSLKEENRNLRQASVQIQARAEQEEEFISNTLLKKIQSLKKEKESLAQNYEQEEEYLTNGLTRKLEQLKQEKVQLEHTLEQEQEYFVNKLMRRIDKLEAEAADKQKTLE